MDFRYYEYGTTSIQPLIGQMDVRCRVHVELCIGRDVNEYNGFLPFSFLPLQYVFVIRLLSCKSCSQFLKFRSTLTHMSSRSTEFTLNGIDVCRLWLFGRTRFHENHWYASCEISLLFSVMTAAGFFFFFFFRKELGFSPLCKITRF